MNLSLSEYSKILDELAEKFIKEQKMENGSATWAMFEQHLIEKYGINGKNQILDKEKWLHYILSRH